MTIISIDAKLNTDKISLLYIWICHGRIVSDVRKLGLDIQLVDDKLTI